MNQQWWKEAIVYQIYPKSYYDTNGDGIGDLKGVTSKLSYLKSLGVNAIWLCPFYKSPMKDNGYDVSDYYSISQEFGTMEDMDELIAEANKHDIKVISDLVLNHTSDQHEWFQDAISNPDSPYRDYYIFKQSKEMPSNGRSIFGGPVWEEVFEGTWYFHTFDKTQPDLNWENPKLRQEIYKMVNYWLEKGINGFRMDAITFIKKNQAFPFCEPDGLDGLCDISANCLNYPGIDDFLEELKQNTYGEDHIMIVGEAPGVPYNSLGKYVGEDGHFSMIFDFSYTDIDLIPNGAWFDKSHFTLADLKKAIFTSQLETQRVGWGAVYLENHDGPRCVNKYFPNDVEELDTLYYKQSLLATLYFFLRGTPFIYQGQEIGMRNCKFDTIDEYDDVNTQDQYRRALNSGYSPDEAMIFAFERSRDNGRTPMQWDKTANAGFSSGTPWLKVNPNYRDTNVENQLVDEQSLFHFYQRMIQLRTNSEYKDVLVYGEFVERFEDHEHIIAYSRVLNNEEIMIVLNFSAQEQKISVDGKEIILGNYETEYLNLDLRPYEAVVFKVR